MKLKYLFLSLIFFLSFSTVRAQYELPSTFPTNVKSIKPGSLIIAMDTVYQYAPGYFNLKAYGLVNYLLQNEVPVMWAIKTNKANKNTTKDFTSTTQRIYPDTTVSAACDFYCGPFIVDSAWATTAWPFITAFANNVNVYKVMTAVNVDIRYTLTFKPRIYFLNTNGYDTISAKILQEAGFTAASYSSAPVPLQIFNGTNKYYSLLSDQHYTGGDTAHVGPVMRYVTNKGANLIANCTAVATYENRGFALTTLGIDSMTSGIASVTNMSHDTPLSQFHGNLITPQGDCKYWTLKAGSAFKATTYHCVKGNYYIVSGAKLLPNNTKGGNVFYLPGHDYYFYGLAGFNGLNQMTRVNGRRVYLNAALIPPGDSLWPLDFTTDVKISLVAQSGFAVKNETFKIYVISENLGPGRAKNVFVNAPMTTGLTYSSCFTTNGTFNSGTGVWSMDSLQKGQIDTLELTVIINKLGNITYNAAIGSVSYETIFPNNSATLSLFGVSRPDAVNDTTYFPVATYLDYNVKQNDSDEDGGPFATTQIISGPWHGSATVTNGDTIRYTLGAGFAGQDSIRYVTCDNLPLCDTAWFYINIPSPLPVTFAGFTGIRKSEKVHLTWFTLGEKQSDYFRLERSNDGKSFKECGRVKAAGNSSGPLRYDWEEADDETPVVYYRLSQYDFDGTPHYCGLLSLTLHKKNSNSFTIFPNPAHESFVIKAHGVEERCTFRLTDLAGRIVFDQQINPDDEGTILQLIEPGNLDHGVYLASLFNESGMYTALKVLIR